MKDRECKAYRYRVSDMMEVNPSDVWVIEKRLIVRADRV